MPRKIAFKNHTQEIKLTTERCIVALVIMIILVTSLIARLAYLQIRQHDVYKTLSKKNWLDIVPIEPTRGLIYDRNGILLAENVPQFDLEIMVYKLKNIPETLARLSAIIPLSDNEIAQFYKEIRQHRKFEEVTLKSKLQESEVAKFYESQHMFPGIKVRAKLMRHYPLGATMSHVLGYVGRINREELNRIDPTDYSASNYIGKLGIEKFYEKELHGSIGYEHIENDASGQTVRILNNINPTPGKNLYLTIDSNLQAVAEQALDGNRGAAVAISPKNGEILALVSEPNYDPNGFVEGLTTEEFADLQNSPDKPLYNRALRGLYPMASAIKVFIALEGIDSGFANPNLYIYDPGWYQIPNSTRKAHDSRLRGHGKVNITEAITSSCDTYFYDLSYRMGIKRIDNILYKFGFGNLTGIDIGEELSGVVASPEWKMKAKGTNWYDGDTINAGIGQGFMQTTPLQLASGTATLANRGQGFTPRLVLAKEIPGNELEYTSTLPKNPIILQNDAAWDLVIDSMKEVVTSPHGTGRRFGRKLPYTVAAKTGTAQVYSIKKRNKYNQAESQDKLAERLRDHSIFIVFAPADNPEIAVAVIAENNNKLAINVARKILDYYFLNPKRMKKGNK